MKLFLNYSIDCELPPDGRFGGPETWDAAEASTRGFIEVMDEFGMAAGATLFVYPDVAMKQRALFAAMSDAGVETALHLHTMRYSRMKKPAWLGSLSREDQREALRMAKADLEDVTGRPCLGFRACYASANHHIHAVCQELGFAWTSTSASGRYDEATHSRWAGGWPFPYHPSRLNKLVPGDLDIYEMPITRGIHARFQDNPDRPFDLRAETPSELAGPQGEIFRRIIEENLVEVARRDQPVRAIVGASHNTNPYADRESPQYKNLARVCDLVVELGEAQGYDVEPASFLAIKEEGVRVGAF